MCSFKKKKKRFELVFKAFNVSKYFNESKQFPTFQFFKISIQS